MKPKKEKREAVEVDWQEVDADHGNGLFNSLTLSRYHAVFDKCIGWANKGNKKKLLIIKPRTLTPQKTVHNMKNALSRKFKDAKIRAKILVNVDKGILGIKLR